VNAVFAMPLEVRLAALAVAGACLGSVVNWAVYRLAWNPRTISPLGPAPSPALPRRLTDRIPILGWLGLRREASVHGRGFWLRPMVVEVVLAAGLPLLYWWEVQRAALLPPELPAPAGPALAMVHVQFLAHALLLALMLAASLIDVDEKIIPDTITVPGTWLGLFLAAAVPRSLLPGIVPDMLAPLGQPIPNQIWHAFDMHGMRWPFLDLTAPNGWPAWLDGRPNLLPLVLALACWWAWCAAILPRPWRGRHGWCRAFGLMLARLRRERVTYRIGVMGLLGSAAIAGVWTAGGDSWRGLLTALVGLAGGGGIVWIVRIVATAVLQREAMGFGDVTLMAMIGTFIGWQACLMVFFLAPLAGLGVGLVQVAVLRDSEIPYGPFLCLATLGLIIFWAPVWSAAWGIFALGWFIPIVVAFCMVLMAAMLGIWMLVKRALFG
jgi:prepilin signal peptidase PulO-like enzyme (type II secretory pathway)